MPRAVLVGVNRQRVRLQLGGGVLRKNEDVQLDGNVVIGDGGLGRVKVISKAAVAKLEDVCVDAPSEPAGRGKRLPSRRCGKAGPWEDEKTFDFPPRPELLPEPLEALLPTSASAACHLTSC